MPLPRSTDEERRRSRRIQLSTPLAVLSLDPYLEFNGQLNATNVSYHGCQLVAPRPFKRETLLQLAVPATNQKTTARVVWSLPVWPEAQAKQWKVGVQLDTPGNYWDLPSQPPDWPMTT